MVCCGGAPGSGSEREDYKEPHQHATRGGSRTPARSNADQTKGPTTVRPPCRVDLLFGRQLWAGVRSGSRLIAEPVVCVNQLVVALPFTTVALDNTRNDPTVRR